MTNANTYIGVDLHKKSCYVTVMDRAGKIAVQKTIPNRKAQLRKFFKNYPGSAVAVESTMNWLPFYETLSSLFINVNLSNPLQTKAIASARIKNDKVDSKILAELLRTNFLPTVYIQPKNIRDLKELVRQRIHFVSMRTRVKNRVHSVLFKTASEHTFSSLFSKKGMSFLKSIRLRRVYREELDQLLETLEHLNVQIQEIEVVIREKAEPDYDCQLLMTIPGISFFSALVIKSEIGDIARFSSTSKLCSYAGLIPSTYASADKVRTGRIT